MEAYLFPIEAALLTFLGLSTTVILPYVLIQYIRYGSVSLYRAVILFSFILYMLCAYYLIILPLPDPVTLKPTADIWQHINIVPFSFVFHFIAESTLKVADIHTYLPALKEAVFLQPAFNFLLTIPFGIYLGYYFKKSLRKTIAFTFLLTLFFELTQLSGLYGIYPCPYRLFDVDDLILNTGGGLIGFLIYKHFLLFLPSRDKIDKVNFSRSEKVGYIRRIFAFGIDYMIISAISNIFIDLLDIPSLINRAILFNILLFVYCVLAQLIFKRTVGKALVHIKLTTNQKDRSFIISVILRYTVLCVILSLFNILGALIKTTYANGTYAILQLIIVAAVCIDFLFSLKNGKMLLYERISKAQNINTR